MSITRKSEARRLAAQLKIAEGIDWRLSVADTLSPWSQTYQVLGLWGAGVIKDGYGLAETVWSIVASLR